MKYIIPKEIPVVNHDASNYDHHFIVKDLFKECEGQFSCLGENAEKYKTFSVSITKDVQQIDKNGEGIA